MVIYTELFTASTGDIDVSSETTLHLNVFT